MKLTLLLSASALALLANAAAAQAQAQAQPESNPTTVTQADPDQLVDDEVVVVTAVRNRSTIPGDAVPETTLAPADIRALGASTVTELLAALGPRVGTGRGRGDGRPVVLVNGRRIAGFREVAQLPTEAILRVEVFPEETALQYGFSADQRVVNFILRDRFRAATVEGSTSTAARGARQGGEFEGGFLQINPTGRISTNFEYEVESAVTERERGIVRSTGGNDVDFRTLLPETETTNGSITYNRGIGKTVGMTVDARFDNTSSRSLLGLAPSTPGIAVNQALARMSETENRRLAVTLDGATRGWQWTAIGTYDQNETDTNTQTTGSILGTGAAQTANSQTRVFEAAVNGTGIIVQAPAGPLRGSFRIGYEDRNLESIAVRNGLTTRGNLSRGETNVRGTLNLPITSRRREYGQAFGDISLGLNGTRTELSDFGSLTSTGLVLNWSPVSDIRLSVNLERSQAAPSIQQLGNPTLVTPGSAVFDFAQGQTVLVTRVSGGNANLNQESREDSSFSLNYAPSQIEGLDINFSYNRQTGENVIAQFPVLTPALEQAFPTRFTRAASGELLSIDQRPINFASNQSENIRYGLSYGKSFGKAMTPPTRGAGPGGPRPQGTPTGAPPASTSGTPPQRAAQPAPQAPQHPPSVRGQGGGGRPGGGGFGGGGFGGGGFGGGQPGRWSMSVYHTFRFDESITLAQGLAPIDILEGGAIDDNGGARRHLVEIEGGASYLGAGFRLIGNWRSATRIAGNTTPLARSSDLFFDDVYNVNLRIFLSTPPRRGIIPQFDKLVGNSGWIYRSRLIVRVDNLTDTVQRVRDSSGNTPEAYQKGLIAPRGRFVEIAWRKQF